MDFLPSNLAVSKEDKAQAKRIVASDENLIVRYLRKEKTVHLAKVPVRDEHGAIIKDDDNNWKTKRKLVICSGTPTAALVAVKVNDALRIGWSRRLDTKTVIETRNLHDAFQELAEAVFKHHTDAADYDETFRQFCNLLENKISLPSKDVEISFSKKGGKEAAVIRALLDDIIYYPKNKFESAYSGPIPNEVARALKWFIPQAEEAFASKAENVVPHADFAGKDLVAV